MPAFLLKNPLASGLGILCLLLGIALGVQTVRLAWSQNETAACEKGRLEDDNKAKQAALDQQQKDRERRDEIDRTYQAELIRARQEASTREQTIRMAAASTCPVAPAHRAYYDSVRREQGANPPGGGQARSGRPR